MFKRSPGRRGGGRGRLGSPPGPLQVRPDQLAEVPLSRELAVRPSSSTSVLGLLSRSIVTAGMVRQRGQRRQRSPPDLPFFSFWKV